MSTVIAEQPKKLIHLGALKYKRVNIALFGKGNVGSALIDQILSRRAEIQQRRDIDLQIFCVTNSSKAYLGNGLNSSWRELFEQPLEAYSVERIIAYAKEQNLQNLIAIDNTASTEFVSFYPVLVKHGFHLISSNKIANTLGFTAYRDLRQLLSSHHKEYLYETNVGAGLPLIDTIKLLHLSGENITRIKGVFSGSLSYICNIFSEQNMSFSDVVIKAMEKGYTEPDPREDLSGYDVARKLLILARELDLENEIDDVFIQNLIPKDLRNVSQKEFLDRIKELDVPFQIKKRNLPKNSVMRYVAELKGDLMKEDGGLLSVRLEIVSKNSVLGQLKGSDSLFEIYTESYGAHPIVIQGAGAGAAVTARGVFGDILRLSDKIY
jgi:homoserine dehydrogenase